MTTQEQLAGIAHEALVMGQRVLIKGGPFGSWTDITSITGGAEGVLTIKTPAIASGLIFMAVGDLQGVQCPEA
jgi:hypothetical protein